MSKNIAYRFRQQRAGNWNDKILEAYFGTSIPFLGLARHSEAEFEPVELLRDQESFQAECSAIRDELSSTLPPDFTESGRYVVRISRPQALFAPESGVCPVVNEADFDPNSWKTACGEWLENISKAQNPGLRQKRESLDELGRELDVLLVQKRFSGPPY